MISLNDYTTHGLDTIEYPLESRKTLLQTSVKSLLISLIIIALIVGEALSGSIFVMRYVDEAVFVVLALFLFIRLIRGLCTKAVKCSLLILVGISCIGLCGNALFQVQESYFAIIVDWCGCIKAPVSFLAIYEAIQGDESYQISNTLRNFAKLIIISSTIFGTISLFYNLGMSGEIRFGIPAFSYIFRQSHSLAIILISSVILISMTEQSKQQTYIYFALAAYSMILTTKGPSLIWVALTTLFFLQNNYTFRLKPRHMILIATVAVILGGYQITNYLLNTESPRYLLMKHAFVTINSHMPTGTGFATYGSDMAAKFYSPLYEEYGFNTYWGMSSQSGQFLNDNYWPMVIGQFGYIGLILTIFLYLNILKLLQNGVKGYSTRILVATGCIYIAIHSLGSASLTSSMGVLLFFIFAIAAGMGKYMDRSKC